MRGDFIGEGYGVKVHYRTLVWAGTTGPAVGRNWPFQVFPASAFDLETPRSDMITVTVTNPTGQTSDPTSADPQPVIVP